MSSRVLTVCTVVLLAVELAAAQTQPGERYYLTLFGTQSVPFRTRNTHTFAEFTRTIPTADGEVIAESHTVSWMPATLHIRPLAVRPEPGVNLSLEETFRWISTFNGRVSAWGPYEIAADRYYPALQRKADLESGGIAYRAIGGLTRSAPISNCGQSFGRAAPVVGRRYLQPTPNAGESGTTHLAERYLRAGGFIDPGVKHTELLPAIGATQYPVTLREPGERIPRFGRW